MKEKSFQNLKVGERVRVSPNLPGYLVVDVSEAKYGAIGICGDLPEHKEAAKRALRGYAEAVRQDAMRPKEMINPRSWWTMRFD